MKRIAIKQNIMDMQHFMWQIKCQSIAGNYQRCNSNSYKRSMVDDLKILTEIVGLRIVKGDMLSYFFIFLHISSYLIKVILHIYSVI